MTVDGVQTLLLYADVLHASARLQGNNNNNF